MHIKLCKKYLHNQYVEKHLESFILVLDRNCFGWNAALVRHRQAQQTDRQRDLDWPQRWVWQQLLLTTPLIFTTVYHHQRYYSTTTKLWIHTTYRQHNRCQLSGVSWLEVWLKNSGGVLQKKKKMGSVGGWFLSREGVLSSARAAITLNLFLSGWAGRCREISL